MSDREPITVEIDEVLPASSEGGSSAPSASRSQTSGPQTPDPFADIGAGFDGNLKNSLGWKARLTLELTRGFLYLRSKKWGNWVIAPLVVLLVILAIPLAMMGILALIILSFLKALTGK